MMKKIDFKTKWPEITMEGLNSFERKYSKYNLKLSESYKYFLTTMSNGGRPVQGIFWDEEKELELGVAFFFPIYEGKSSIEQKLKFIYEDDIFPLGLLPFASDGGSGNYLISMRKEDFGQISIMYSDSEVPLILCNSFEEFINKLEEE